MIGKKINFEENFNKAQKEALINIDGPCLIVAGAGSGKTKVLTARAAQIIKSKKAWPTQILCVTFTNKAAREMQNRISKLLEKNSQSLPWLGTFHSLSAKFLRRHAETIGLNSRFTILDKEDQIRLIKNISKAENIDFKKISPQIIISVIDRWKNKGLLPDKVKINKNVPFENIVLKVYKIYQTQMKKLNCCDFGDLILHCVTMFENYPDILKTYSSNFKYLLVDEYQDTNLIQSKWLSLLSQTHQNICCVGDDDQSIYSWRGAEIKNFLTFEKHYKKSKIIKLEQNYRSTQNILTAASALISNNKDRLGKKLWTEGEDGKPIQLSCFRDGKDEATNIGDIIEKKLKKKYRLNDISILVRAIFQTREFEERFLKIGLPYRIVGGTKFYDRAEIKDCISYLRLIHQNKDDLAFERVVNNPKRSVGESSINILHDWSKKNNLCLEDSALNLIELDKLKPKTKISLKNILELFKKWRLDLKNKKHYEVMEIALDESGYSKMLKEKKDFESENRLENIKELIRGMQEFENLSDFLEHVALATSIDQDWNGEKVNLMTMHAAKGLEFDVIFLPGWEEGLFPHKKSLEEKGDFALEEERRLAYVGITRAKKEAYISCSMGRIFHGEWMDSIPSRFIDELPKENVIQFENNNSNKEIFEFNQDIDYEVSVQSPGWKRLKKRKLIEKK